MNRLILPTPWTQQPQQHLQIDRSNKFGLHVISGVNGGVPFVSVDGRTLVRNDAYQGAGVLKFDGTGNNRIEYGVVQPSGAFSIAARLRKPTAHSNNCPVFDNKIDTDWGNNVGFAFNIRSDNGVLFSVGSSETRVESGPFGDTKPHRVSAIFKPGVTQDFYVDGVKPTYSASAVASDYNAVSRRLATGTYYDQLELRSGASEIQYAILFNAAFTPAELEEFHANPWQIFAPMRRALWVATTGGSSVDLSIFGSSHGHFAEAFGLTSLSVLSVSDSSHAQTTENITLGTTGTANLLIAEASHTHAADGVTLTTQWLLSIAESLHSHSAESSDLTTQWLLSVLDASHAHSADSTTLDTSNAIALTVQESAHSHSAESAALSVQAWLQIVEAAHWHTADAPTLTNQTALAIAEALHAQYADTIVLGNATFTPEQLAEILAYVESQMAVPTTAEIAAAVLAALQANPSVIADPVWNKVLT